MRDARIPEAVIELLCEESATVADWRVAGVLYVHADAQGRAWPSIGKIASVAHLDRRTVTRALSRLEASGVFTRERPHIRGSRDHTVYHLLTRGACAPSQTARVGAGESPTRGARVPRLGVGEPSKQEELEQSLNSGDLFEEFWKGYPLQRDRERARTAFAALVARGEDPQDLVKAATAYAVECRRDGREDRYVLRAHRFLDPGVRRFAEYVDLYAPPTTECSVCGGLGFVEDLERDVAYECRECHSRGVVEIASEPA
ncbi:MAG: helix-turn-helix domain-containing protein [Thermoleophilia bacterium]